MLTRVSQYVTKSCLEFIPDEFFDNGWTNGAWGTTRLLEWDQTQYKSLEFNLSSTFVGLWLS